MRASAGTGAFALDASPHGALKRYGVRIVVHDR